MIILIIGLIILTTIITTISIIKKSVKYFYIYSSR